MAECNWDPKKHGGRPCPVHGGGGLWDENVFTRQEKLKKAGYTDEDLKDADEDFDGDYDDEFKPTADDFMEELSDNDYIYGGLGEQDIYNKMAERLSKKYNTEITPEEVANSLKEGGFAMDEYNKSLEDDGEETKTYKNPNRKDKYGNLLVDDEAFEAGQKGAKKYLDEALKYNDLETLKKSNVFLSGLQDAVNESIEKYNPNFDLTYQDFNEIIGSVLGEDVDFEEYEQNATKGFTGNKYSGYNVKKVPTLDTSLREQVLNGEITLDEAASELNRAGWKNFKPSKEETLKILKLDKEPQVELKKRISKEDADNLLKKDYKSLSDEEKENLIRYFKNMR